MTLMSDPDVDAHALFSVSGRRALVTGASSGIGERIATTLAARGATVLAVGRRRTRLDDLASRAATIVPVVADITTDDGIATIERTIAAEGVDICVNNAGTSGDADPASESIEHFLGVLEVNLVGHYRVTQVAARTMLERGRGSIINIASIYGLVASAPITQPGYCAAKGAIVNLTRELAVTWARGGVRVNAIAPGYFPTEITEHMWSDDRTVGFIRRNCPMGRAGELSELDGAVVFLASDASSYVTGQVIAVDGGWTAR